MKILVLGALGMAGHVVAAVIQEAGHSVTGFARECSPYCKTHIGDARDMDAVRRVLADEAYDAVVNCIGVLNTDVDVAPASGIYLNSVLPHLLVQCTEGTNTRVVQLSTDCVFSGTNGGYCEDSFRDADSLYGRSKALGEINDKKNLTVRTSIVGPDLRTDGKGLFNWFMTQKEAIKGYCQAFWTGVTTVELAKAIIAALECRLAGIYHLVNGEKISKYHLLMLFNQMRKFPVEILSENTVRVDKSLLCMREDFAYNVPSYEKMVVELEHWIRRHPQMYPHYQLTYGEKTK